MTKELSYLLGNNGNTNNQGGVSMTNNKSEFDFSFAAHFDKYPPFIARVEVHKYFPWLSSKRLANLDSLGEGPSHVIKNGRAIIYPTKQFLNWLDTRTTNSAGSSSPVRPGGNNEGKRSETSVRNTRRGRKSKKQEVMERRG